MDIDKYVEILKREIESGKVRRDDAFDWIRALSCHRYRFDRIVAAIPEGLANFEILDVGTSYFTVFLKLRFPNYHFSTIDQTPLHEGECRLNGIHFLAWDLAKQPIPLEDSSYDLIVFTEVLEHVLARPSLILSELSRILKPGGKMIVSVPNVATLYNRIRLLFGKGPSEDFDRQLKGFGHVHEYTMAEVASLLDRAGLAVLQKEFIHPTSLLDKAGLAALQKEFIHPRSFATENLLYKGFMPFHQLLCAMVPSFRGCIFLICEKRRD